MRTLLLLLLFLAQTTWADYPLEIVPLKHQTVEQMLPLLRPFVEADGTVTGMNGQLIIRTSPENLQQLQKIIDRFDRTPRQLLIWVRQGENRAYRQRSAGVEGTLPMGDKGSVTIGRPRDGLHAHVQGRSGHHQEDGTQRIRATEGMPAFIQAGQEVPVTTWGTDAWGRPLVTREYRDVTTGFHVTPWISGDRVTLEIAPFRRNLTRHEDRFRVQEMNTRVTGRLGEWIELGAVLREATGSRREILGAGDGSSSGQAPVQIRVELLDQ